MNHKLFEKIDKMCEESKKQNSSWIHIEDECYSNIKK